MSEQTQEPGAPNTSSSRTCAALTASGRAKAPDRPKAGAAPGPATVGESVRQGVFCEGLGVSHEEWTRRRKALLAWQAESLKPSKRHLPAPEDAFEESGRIEV